MRFLADEMMRNVARWLRLLGYDTEFFSGNDTAVLDEAKKSRRILLTKDGELGKRAEKAGIPFLLLKQERLEEGLAIIMDKYGLEIGFPEKTRCPECNGKLEEKECRALEGIPADVIEEKRRCWKCSSCGKNYWEGGHWKNIRKVLAKIEAARNNLKSGEV